MTEPIHLFARPRQFSLLGVAKRVFDLAVTYGTETNWVDSSANQMVDNSGNTLIFNAGQTTRPYPLSANKRTYVLNAPEVQL